MRNGNKDITIDAGIEQCCANTGSEGSCTKTNNNIDCYTKIGSNSNLNNRPCNAFMPMVNNNDIEYCPVQAQTERPNTNIHSINSNLNNRPCNAILPIINNN